MSQLQQICEFLEEFAPSALAEEWDNVGLLAGDPAASVRRVMTCLTVTPQTAAEAVEQQVDLVVTHHPLPFRPLKRIVTDNPTGKLLWNLLTAGIALYSPHTAFDSTAGGINQRLADGFQLSGIQPLVPIEGAEEGAGSGRRGEVPETVSLRQFAARLRDFLRIDQLQYVGDLDAPVKRVAVACGAAGSFLHAAREAECDLLVLGETNLHTCLEAEATGIALLLPGHYASERFAVEGLADVLYQAFPDLSIWPSRHESDPLAWFRA